MPDLSSIADALQRGFGELPPIAIALGLLAGPTVAFIGYRLIGAARGRQSTTEVEAAPLWVCHDCRSVNQFRNERCYRCGAQREAAGEIEVLLDQPASRPSTFEAPAGSPFAARGSLEPPVAHDPGPGIPVMGHALDPTDAVAVGPGRPTEAAPADVPVSGEPRALEEPPASDEVSVASSARKRRQ
jgi:hypothetical protein